MKGGKGNTTHIVKLSSVIIHLTYTEYIFIHSLNKYFLDTYYMLGIIPGRRVTEEKIYSNEK